MFLENASQTEYKDLIAELKILIHIGQNKHIVNLLGACTKGICLRCPQREDLSIHSQLMKKPGLEIALFFFEVEIFLIT